MRRKVPQVWCKSCNIETTKDTCPVCGTKTVEDIPVEIYWCPTCRIPIVQETNKADKGKCPICKSRTKYLASDIRPVFPEERLLLEILLEKEPNSMIDSSVWAENNRYFIDGESVSLPMTLFQSADTDRIASLLNANSAGNSYTTFDENIRLFCKANQTRLNYLKEEAFSFVKRASQKFDEESISY